MKIAIPTQGHGLDCDVNEHFGRAERFLLVDLPGRSFHVWENPYKDGRGGVGVKVASALMKERAELVFVGSLGPPAEEVLDQAGGKVLRDCQGSIDSLLSRFESGELEANA